MFRCRPTTARPSRSFTTRSPNPPKSPSYEIYKLDIKIDRSYFDGPYYIPRADGSVEVLTLQQMRERRIQATKKWEEEKKKKSN